MSEHATPADTLFAQLAAAEREWRLGEFPQLATRVGESSHDHRLDQVEAWIARRLAS
jgi:hypothetical protein